MNDFAEHERKVIVEFCHLLEKSKHLFNGLRDLPQYGHKQWYTYFGRAFDVYTKLWKFQQQHRDILDIKYGLKRWQIGEIASKIGQLYYHFYLRTSETAYLSEAYSFYFAIRGRAYYTKAVREDRSDLMVKKLRFYARFIVVCLILKKMKLVRDLIKELDTQIMDYGNTYDPVDQLEWTVVVDEVKSFVKAEPVVVVLNSDNYPVTLSYRLNALIIPPVERSQYMTFQLCEALIIGSCSEQVKFSEMTMDMYRMLQTMEREPSEENQQMFDNSPGARGFPTIAGAPIDKDYLENSLRRENPHKFLLFKPSVNQVLVYLSSGCKDLPPHGALLVYISADGYFAPSGKQTDNPGYDLGGIITSSRRDIYRDASKNQKVPPQFKEVFCLHPGDLYPFTRRPLFIVLDSENSFAFQHIPNNFGQPLVVLMSPVELPSPFHELQRRGSLFTLFLHSPLSAFCFCCDIPSVTVGEWDRGQACVERFLGETSRFLTRGRTDPTYLSFMGDDFLRLLILRYVFCDLVLRMHRAFRARTHLPKAVPSLPEELFEQPVLINIIWDLITLLDVRRHFNDAPSVSGGGSSGLPATTAPKE